MLPHLPQGILETSHISESLTLAGKVTPKFCPALSDQKALKGNWALISSPPYISKATVVKDLRAERVI
jgi:hypothetical protein